MPLSDITVTTLTRQAEVNKNSFYYHYRNMDEFIEEALSDIFDSSIPLAFLSAMSNELISLKILLSDGNLEARLERVIIFAQHCDSEKYRESFKSALHTIWMQASPRAEEDFSGSDLLTLHFTSAGLLEIISKLDTLDRSLEMPANAPLSYAERIEMLFRSNFIRRIAALVIPVLFPDEPEASSLMETLPSRMP